MASLLIINGPNLNMLGKREPNIYGNLSLSNINSKIITYAKQFDIECECYQSNHEGDIIDHIHSVNYFYDGCIINPGAFTHYSYAVRDAIAAVNKPFIEVHISNTAAREEFRHTSVVSAVCDGTIAGFGANSYILAVSAMNGIINKKEI